MTGFLAKGKMTRAVTTLGRGGSDLSATVLGAALQLKEVQVRRGGLQGRRVAAGAEVGVAAGAGVGVAARVEGGGCF